jgi:ABC-2 type transport system permease protein
MKKELTEQVRSAKLWIVLGVFAFFGVLNPGLTYITPILLETMQDVLAESGMNITIIDVNALDSWAEFFSNISLALIVFGTVYGSIFTREFRTGTLILSLTKGLKRYKVIISKSVILAAVWTVAYWLCFGVSYLFTELFWDNSITEHLGLAAFCWWLYGILIVALITLFSTVFSSFGGVILGVGGVIFTESLISIIPKAIEYLPTNLMGGASLVYGMSEPQDFVASIIISVVIIIASFAASVPIFNKKQI